MPGAVRINILSTLSKSMVTIVEPSALMVESKKIMSGGDTKGACVYSPGARRINILKMPPKAVVTNVEPSALMVAIMKSMSGGATKRA